jgi:hypothetical protein
LFFLFAEIADTSVYTYEIYPDAKALRIQSRQQIWAIIGRPAMTNDINIS